MSEAGRHREEWEARYRAGRTAWDRGAVSPALERWHARGLLIPGRILVPGCGKGHEVVTLARLGFTVTAVDVAPSPVAALRRTLTEAGVEAEVLEADVLEWEPSVPFDAVYEQTFLCALDPPTWPAYVARLARWLVPGGPLFALFMQTRRPGGPPYHCELGEMRDLLREPEWVWPEGGPMVVPHPNGFEELGYVLTRRCTGTD